jgi:hypothetical protein
VGTLRLRGRPSTGQALRLVFYAKEIVVLGEFFRDPLNPVPGPNPDDPDPMSCHRLILNFLNRK